MNKIEQEWDDREIGPQMEKRRHNVTPIKGFCVDIDVRTQYRSNI